MQKILPLTIITLCCVAFCPRQASALNMSAPAKPKSKPKFVYKDSSGKMSSVEIVDKYQPTKIVRPFARIDSKIDPKLRRAATIAEERARAHSHSQCWRFVKEALVAAGVVSSRPTRCWRSKPVRSSLAITGSRRSRYPIRTLRRLARYWSMALVARPVMSRSGQLMVS